MISDFRACLQFCYNAILQKELYRVARHWNTHKIRPYPNQDTPAGKPDVLFFLPEVTGKNRRFFQLISISINSLKLM